MIELLKNSPKQEGQDTIYIAGEKEYLAAEYNRAHGVPLLSKIVEDLKTDGEKLGVPFQLKAIE